MPRANGNSREQLKEYELMQTLYSQEGATQTTQMFLRIISASPVVPKAFRQLPLLRHLCEATKELMLNELEVALWAIYLERLVWPVAESQISILFAAFASKIYLNDDIAPVEAQLNRRITNFTSMYEAWCDEKLFTVTPRELNGMFRALTRVVQLPQDDALVDYNYYVDDILQIAPSNIPQDDLEPPPLLNFSSVLNEGNEEPFEELAMSRNLSVNSDWMQAFSEVTSLSRVNSRF